MTSADRLIEVFNEAKTRPAGPGRERFLAEACRDSPELKAQVVSLLQAHDGAGDFLKNTLLSPTAPITEKSGDKIGHYKLLQQIGEGGCGVVYMAEQAEPVRRRVALKVIKLGMDTKQVVARFEAERQALALMDHPNIAKVFDAGATDTGRSYFVMELVRGIKITDYCDQNNLSTTERLDLFVQVCQAVQHAHQKGIIHRDIKPSNILVTQHDSVAVPKVIDFGIAKATTDQQLTDKTLFTAFEQFIGTPAYMSPEQAQMSGLDIDTRTDIYSLGVLLYELLTGKTPFDAKELIAAGLDEMRRTIREKEPIRPSTRLSTMLAGELTTTAKHRGSDPPELIHLLRGDLDWIVMRCLEKDRSRRYETSNGLALDIKRHLNHEPVSARPPNNLYRLQKAIRRHKTAFATATSMVVVLIIAVIVSTSQAIRARRAEREQIRLGWQAQTANRDLRDTVSSLELQRAENFFRNGDAGTAVAHLAATLRRDPSNRIAATRLVSALAHRNWALRLPVTMRHADHVETVSLSPDGRHVLSASRDQTAKIWDPSTGQSLAVLQHTGLVFCAHYNASGTRIITASADTTARIWDSITGESSTPPLQHEDKVYWAEFSTDDRWIVTASADKTARIWDATTGALKHELRERFSHLVRAQFSPDNKRVVTGGSHGLIRIWDADSGEMLFRIEDRASPLTVLEFSPDGRRLVVVCQDGIARLWNIETRTEIKLSSATEPMKCAVFSPDSGSLLMGSLHGTTRYWDVNTGLTIGALPAHEGSVISAEFGLDGRKIVTLTKGHSAQVWDARTQLLFCPPIRAPEDFTAAKLSPDGEWLVTAGQDGSVHVWNLQPRRFAGLETHFQSEVSSISFSSDGKSLVASSLDGTARILDSRTSETISRLQHPAALDLAEFSPDGNRIFTAATNGLVQLWDWRKGVSLAGPFPCTRLVFARFNPKGDRLVTGAVDGTARVWDAQTWQPITPALGNYSVLIFMPRFSPDGRFIVTAGTGHGAYLWDATTGEPVLPPLPHPNDLRWADFSADGKKLATTSRSETAFIWDLRTGQLALPPLQHTRVVESAQFSPDGRRIITASPDHTVQIWDTSTGSALTPSLKHDHALAAACFSRDGELAMSGCWNGSVRAWDSKTGQPLTEPLETEGLIWRFVAFDPTGQCIAAGGKDGILRVWPIPSSPTPIPEWFLTFAETVAGIRLGARGQVELVPPREFEASVRDHKLRDKSEFYARLARWFLAQPADRERVPF